MADNDGRRDSFPTGTVVALAILGGLGALAYYKRDEISEWLKETFPPKNGDDGGGGDGGNGGAGDRDEDRVEPTPTTTTLYGYVNDTTTMSDLSGVKVTLEDEDGGSVTVTSNSMGKFRFTDVGIGKYTVTYEKECYETETYTTRVTKENISYPPELNMGMIPLSYEIFSEKGEICNKGYGDEWSKKFCMPMKVASINSFIKRKAWWGAWSQYSIHLQKTNDTWVEVFKSDDFKHDWTGEGWNDDARNITYVGGVPIASMGTFKAIKVRREREGALYDVGITVNYVVR